MYYSFSILKTLKFFSKKIEKNEKKINIIEVKDKDLIKILFLSLELIYVKCLIK